MTEQTTTLTKEAMAEEHEKQGDSRFLVFFDTALDIWSSYKKLVEDFPW